MTWMLFASASYGDNGGSITVAGHGELETEPDTAQISLGVTITGEDVMKMKRQVDETMSKLLVLTKELKLKQEDVSATQLNVSPQYNYQSGESKLTGYETTRGVTITLHQLDKLNELLDGAIEAGANRIDSIQLTTSNMTSSRANTVACDCRLEEAGRIGCSRFRCETWPSKVD